jgi:hypothetical protein
MTILAVAVSIASTVHAAQGNNPPGRLFGEVQTADNEPAPNVAVAIVRVEHGRTVSPAIRTQTDQKGRYMIDISSLQAGKYVVIVNPGPTMAGGHEGGQTIVRLDGPQDSKRLDWRLTANPPVLPIPNRN